MKIIYQLKFDNKKLVEQKKINYIVLHHRAGTGSVKSIHDSHIARGWAGIGYHYYIRFSGEIYKGRPDDYVGAHCVGHNTGSIGVCLEGDFTKQKPTEKQLDSLRDVVRYLLDKYPKAKIKNHKDFGGTICPVIDLVTIVKDKLDND